MLGRGRRRGRGRRLERGGAIKGAEEGEGGEEGEEAGGECDLGVRGGCLPGESGRPCSSRTIRSIISRPTLMPPSSCNDGKVQSKAFSDSIVHIAA